MNNDRVYPDATIFEDWSKIPMDFVGWVRFDFTIEHFLLFLIKENQERHCLTGPAGYNSNGAVYYYIFEHEFNEEEFYAHPLVVVAKLERILSYE